MSFYMIPYYGYIPPPFMSPMMPIPGQPVTQEQMAMMHMQMRMGGQPPIQYQLAYSNPMPLYTAEGASITLDKLPSNTIYKWADTLGGETLDGPIPFGTIRPDGKPAHGGIVSKRPTGETVCAFHRIAPKK